jgi:hypothetical protein
LCVHIDRGNRDAKTQSDGEGKNASHDIRITERENAQIAKTHAKHDALGFPLPIDHRSARLEPPM